MGTRSNTLIVDEWPHAVGKTGEICKSSLLNLYGQYDGYPSSHGLKLAQWLETTTVVNGLEIPTPDNVANGAGCLAAQMVSYFKIRPGGFYIEGTVKNWQIFEHPNDYTYIVRVWASRIAVIVYHLGSRVFSGDCQEFKSFCANHELT